jgi:hypothetical protein
MTKVTNKKTGEVYQLNDDELKKLKESGLAGRFVFDKSIAAPPEVAIVDAKPADKAILDSAAH